MMPFPISSPLERRL